MTGSAPRLLLHELEMQDAQKAFDAGLYRACILHCLLAIEGFVWDLLLGKKDIRVIFPPETEVVPFSSVDLVFDYIRPRCGGPDYPSDYKLTHPDLKPYLQAFREANKRLFKKSHGPDGSLLRQAVETGLLRNDETELVFNLRSIRNFCCHFNPYSRTLYDYRKALESVGIEFKEFKELPQVASYVLLKTKGLIEKCRERMETQRKLCESNL